MRQDRLAVESRGDPERLARGRSRARDHDGGDRGEGDQRSHSVSFLEEATRSWLAPQLSKPRAGSTRDSPMTRRRANQAKATVVTDEIASAATPAIASGGRTTVATVLTPPATRSQGGTVRARQTPASSTRLPTPTTTAPAMGISSMWIVS